MALSDDEATRLSLVQEAEQLEAHLTRGEALHRDIEVKLKAFMLDGHMEYLKDAACDLIDLLGQNVTTPDDFTILDNQQAHDLYEVNKLCSLLAIAYIWEVRIAALRKMVSHLKEQIEP